MAEGFYFLVLFMFLTAVNLQTDAKPEITSLHITSDIRYRFSTTLVTSTVANKDNTSVEAEFKVTLPDAAFITDFVMEIDGQLYPGKIDEKEKAKKTYEKAKKKGQSAGHIAQKPRHTNLFSVEVNVAAESHVTFNLTYQELLERVYGEYEHIIYIDPGQVVPDFKINVVIQESRKIKKVFVPPLRNDKIQDRSIEEGTNALVTIETPTPTSAVIHYSPTVSDQKKQSEQGISGLFVVEYDVERKSDAGEIMVVDGYFVHYFAPDGMDPIPKDVLFILDISGSMSGRKSDQLIQAMKKIIEDLHEGDAFNIMEFSSNIYMWKQVLISATRKNKEKALVYLSSSRPRGSTAINKAMMKGIDFLNKAGNGTNRMQLIVFLTDGHGDSGANLVLNNVNTANTEGISIFSLAFGRNADYTFIKKLALNHKGVARKIFEDSDAALQIQNFYDEISASALQNVTFKYLGDNEDLVENTTQLNFNAFYNGKELVIAGKLSEDDVETVSLVVTGNGKDGTVELTLKSDLEGDMPELTKPGDYEKITERIWAYLTIKQVLEDAIGTEDLNKKKDLNNKALELALKYKFVTPLTSMVVTKPEKNDVGALEENEDAKLALAANSGRGSSPPRRSRPSTGQQTSHQSTPSRGGNSGGGRGGGGGGDPHFMIRINGIEFPICFDVVAKEGDVLQMLKDPIAGVTINAGIMGSSVKNMYGEFKTFIGEFVILAPGARINVKPDDIIFNGASLSWNAEHIFQITGITIHMISAGVHNRIMKVDLGNDIKFEVKRYMKEDTGMAVSYLNMYIDKETGMSNIAGGLLGQFVHKNTTLFKITLDKEGREHGHFRETGISNSKYITRFTAILHKKPDIITGEIVECWNAHRKVEGLLDGDIRDYFTTDIKSP